jgi:hypothetical protein
MDGAHDSVVARGWHGGTISALRVCRLVALSDASPATRKSVNNVMSEAETVTELFDICLETDFERSLVLDQRLQDGLLWGEKRSGHPEGEVGWHVRDVLLNVDAFYRYDKDRQRLRVAALVHDTFKKSASEQGRNHADIAADFLKEFTDDSLLIALVKHHDEPYKAFKNRSKTSLQTRLQDLRDAFRRDLDLLIKFYHCDNSVPGKNAEAFEWFVHAIKGR